jgi:Cu(I)/Ag(I) efflux system membrane protein CusA/SilA
MIEKTIEYSVRNPLIVILAALAVAGLGIYAMFQTPIDAIPDLSENQVIVFADWPGRSPQEVEDQVTTPLSRHLQGLAGVRAIRAQSDFGFSMVNIIFEDNIDFYFARQRVLERLSLAATFLPEGVVPYLAPDATALGQIFWYVIEGKGYDLGQLRALQDWYVRYQLNSVPGVAEVASVGGMPKEYQIDVDPAKLRAYGVTLRELYEAVQRSNLSVGGRVIQKAGSEYLIRSVGWVQSVRDLERTVIKSVQGTPIYVGHVATVQLGPSWKRGILEKDGQEAVGGVVLMRQGENPLEVTQRIKRKIAEIQPGLPEGVRIVPFYDRTPLIHAAIDTLKKTLLEATLSASAAVLLILRHVRSAVVICLTLPMAILVSFNLMWLFKIPSNIMSLSGIAISIGVLVDSSIVMLENATHHLHRQFGGQPVRGNTRDLVLPALKSVGRPLFFSVMIMLISFLPVFALRGIEGKWFHPFAYTKTFAMIGVSILAITLVPALIPLMVRGRLRHEEESWLVRSVLHIYRPALNFLLEHPWPIVLVTGAIFILGSVPAGIEVVFRIVVGSVFGIALWIAWRDRSWVHRTWGLISAASLLVLALVADQRMARLGRAFMPPLEEGILMDMPITVPRASLTQAADDLKARDALLRTFPEVALVVGKAGRAETATDPAPVDMVETVVNLRPQEHWPRRELPYETALQQTQRILESLVAGGWVQQPTDELRDQLLNTATMAALAEFDRHMRDKALVAYQAFEKQLGPKLVHVALREILSLLRRSGRLTEEPQPELVEALEHRLASHYGEWLARSPDLPTVSRVAEEAARALAQRKLVEWAPDLFRLQLDPFRQAWRGLVAWMGGEPPSFFEMVLQTVEKNRHREWEQEARRVSRRLTAAAAPRYTSCALDALEKELQTAQLWRKALNPEERERVQQQLVASLADGLLLWPRTITSLRQELDTVVRLPGWGNIWTRPIQNRVDMLSTGIRTMVGVKVFGKDLYQIQEVAQEIAEVLKSVPGAVDVVPDQIAGEGYLEIRIDREKAARYGINIGDVQDVIETALGGKVITMTVEGRERFPIRIRYARAFREDEEHVRALLVPATTMSPLPANRAGAMNPGGAREAVNSGPAQIPLGQIAEVRLVEGPSMIKTENGILRAYVQLNVRGRDVVGFVEEARRAVAQKVEFPEGTFIEWSGEFEHRLRARRTLALVVPAAFLLIFFILYLTYHDLADTLLIMLAVPGAIFGGVLFQYLFGFEFTVAVWVGFIACFGLATETGVIMLVYLREAIENRGGLGQMSLQDLKEAVLEGAVHRLRPKLLTEGTTIVGLAPMLWSKGPGSEFMRPMAAPVLGGILVADEVIDLLLPVLFYIVRRYRWHRLHHGAALGPTGSSVTPVAPARD